MEMVLVYDGLEAVAKENNMTVEQLKEYQAECRKNDPKEQKLAKYRYHLESTYDGYDCFYDSLEKKYIEIHGEKRCEKWRAAHQGEWCTNF